MTFEKVLEEIKKNKKVKHKSWNSDSLIVEGYCGNMINLREEGWLHYFTIQEFTTAFGKLKNDWDVIND